MLRIVAGERVLAEAPVAKLHGEKRLESWLSDLSSRRAARRGRARVSLRVDRDALEARARRAIRVGGGTVRAPERTVAASVRLPIVEQALRNNCETAALSMLLAARDVRASQLRLQRDLARSGEPDPKLDAGGGLPTWGDPREGFVGRADGGGTSGGYGVYQDPVRALARTRGVALEDLSGAPPQAIYRRLLAGRPVMVWVGLSDGPFKSWRTPDGGTVTGNFGEHTVVLTGISGEGLSVNDPLDGERKTWTRERFETLWSRLGKRALAV